MIPYILYAALILTACFIFYKLLLRKETFFHLNRFVLLSCMALAFTLPLVRVPSQLSFRSPQPSTQSPVMDVKTNETATPVLKNLTPLNSEPVQVKQGLNFEKAMQWLVYLYWFGVIIFAGNFIFQAGLLLYKAYALPVIKDGRFRIVEITDDGAPCSFANNIFINPSRYEWATYNQVLQHEKIHIEQKHTVDLLLAELMLIFQWFNPFAWAWRKEIENNLEFFTDQKLLQQPEVEKESYQLSLLKVAAPHFPLGLTTNYNQSLLKKRIIMMNAKRSSLHTAWKYFFLLPLMVLFVCLLNEPVTNAQPLAKQKSLNHQHSDINTSGYWFATIKGSNINIQFKNDDEPNSSNGTTFLLSDFKDLPRDKPGTFNLTREAGTMEFKGKFDGDKGMGEYKFAADKAYSDDLRKQGIDVLEDRDGMVFFIVNVKRDYVRMLRQQGYTDLDKDKIIPLAALDISEAYINSIKQAGFKDISLDNLVPFKALNVDKAYIEEIRKAGYKNISPDKIITFKAQGIDAKYIADFRSSSKEELVEKEETVEPAHSDKNKNSNNNKNSQQDSDKQSKNKSAHGEADEDDMIAYKALKIDAAYVNSLADVGYKNLSTSNLISMKSVGVTPEFIKSLRDAGYTNIKADDLVALKAQNITPALIRQYKELGFDDLNIDDVIGAKATGTSPSFIITMREKGHKMKSLDKYIALKSVLGE